MYYLASTPATGRELYRTDGDVPALVDSLASSDAGRALLQRLAPSIIAVVRMLCRELA